MHAGRHGSHLVVVAAAAGLLQLLEAHAEPLEVRQGLGGLSLPDVREQPGQGEIQIAHQPGEAERLAGR